MPFSFICIAILLLFSIVLSYYYGLNIKPYAFVCIMAIILISYFVPSVNIFNNISLNILCVASLISYIVISMFNMNLKEVGKQAIGCVLCVSAYILIVCNRTLISSMQRHTELRLNTQTYNHQMLWISKYMQIHTVHIL